MKYIYTPLTTFFKPTTWTEDIKGSFGLVPSLDWAGFKASIEDLSAKCPSGESIKVIFLARHGHGKHNIIHEQYATWEEAKKVDTPHDASLADSGIIEALEVGESLKREYGKGMPLPEKWFVSSLKRTVQTCELEWGWLKGGEGEGVRATVIENLRESLTGGRHNSRSSKSHLQTIFPHFTFHPEMTEEDEMWVPETWEKEEEGKMIKRVGEGFEQCLELSEGSTYINLTSHKTATERLRLFLGMEERVMGLCEMNILVLRVKKRDGGDGGDISGS